MLKLATCVTVVRGKVRPCLSKRRPPPFCKRNGTLPDLGAVLL